MSALAPPIPTSPYIESILQHLEGSTYFQRRLFIKNRIADQYPRFLYKYFPLDPANEKSVDRLRDVVVRSRLWLADHATFNDPFDLKVNIGFGGSAKQKEDRLRRLIANQSPHSSRKERRAMLKGMMEKPAEEFEETLRKVFRIRSRDVGVCSFAGDPRSIVMWAHYGRNHEGVCLQFELASDPRNFFTAVEVEYSKEYPKIDFVNLEAEILTPLVRKHMGWEYEDEWRILHMTGARTYLPFNGGCLRRIFMGCRAPGPAYAVVDALLDERKRAGDRPVHLFRATQHPTDYKIRLWCLRER